MMRVEDIMGKVSTVGAILSTVWVDNGGLSSV